MERHVTRQSALQLLVREASDEVASLALTLQCLKKHATPRPRSANQSLGSSLGTLNEGLPGEEMPYVKSPVSPLLPCAKKSLKDKRRKRRKRPLSPGGAMAGSALQLLVEGVDRLLPSLALAASLLPTGGLLQSGAFDDDEGTSDLGTTLGMQTLILPHASTPVDFSPPPSPLWKTLQSPDTSAVALGYEGSTELVGDETHTSSGVCKSADRPNPPRRASNSSGGGKVVVREQETTLPAGVRTLDEVNALSRGVGPNRGTSEGAGANEAKDKGVAEVTAGSNVKSDKEVKTGEEQSGMKRNGGEAVASGEGEGRPDWDVSGGKGRWESQSGRAGGRPPGSGRKGSEGKMVEARNEKRFEKGTVQQDGAKGHSRQAVGKHQPKGGEKDERNTRQPKTEGRQRAKQVGSRSEEEERKEKMKAKEKAQVKEEEKEREENMKEGEKKGKEPDKGKGKEVKEKEKV
eukprot:Sspe_Gene.55120::Locus_30351_Transcript_1_1_Confidence_1.000_Length_1427::g.55120::m.55120